VYFVLYVLALGSLVVIIPATEPKVHGFKPGQGQWIFWGEKIHSTTIFRWEVKLLVSYHLFYIMLKILTGIKTDTS
jgi:hypothetical protein